MPQSILTTKQQLRSIWNLGGLTPAQLARMVWQTADEDNILGRASELAFNFLLALFPLLLFLISLFGLFASGRVQLRADLFFYLAQVLPPPAFDLVTKTIREVMLNSSGGKLTFGIVFAAWAASGGMTTMISTLNGAYHIRESRSWIKTHLISVGLTIAISVLVVAAMALVLGGNYVADFLGERLGIGSALLIAWEVFLWPAAVFFLVLSFALIYYIAPDVKEQYWYWITPGSIFGVTIWLLASMGLRAYLHFFNLYSRTYGSLGAIIILMLWFYVTGLAFLLGGEINAALEHSAAEHGHPEAKKIGRKAA